MASDSTRAAVIVAVYPSEDETKAALKQLQDMARQGTIDLLEAASVTKDMDGKIHVKDTADLGTKKGTRRGAIIGGVMGLIFPPSIIVGALAGGGVGALYGHFRDKGFSNTELAQAGEELEPGQSGLIAVMVDKFVDQVAQGLEGYAKLDKTLLDADASAAVLAETAPA
jgi:uncharacterized membrane protein